MRTLILLLPAALVGCGDIGFDAVSIRPIYGWVDGCTDVKISGHGFGSDVAATVGGSPVTDISMPDADSGDRLDALNAGFFFNATVPASPTGAKGFADVEVSSGGESDVIPAAFYYVECPGAIYPEAVSPNTGLVGGESIGISGCNLDAAAYDVYVVGEAGTTSLTSVCGTAEVSFTAPTGLADGTYEVQIFATGADPGVEAPLYPACYGDPKDTGYYGYYCDPAITITYGGDS